jgi:uncharacterized protein
MVTGLYAGILALIFVGLSFNVILRRMKLKVLFGDNNNPVLTTAMRIHGNFAEYVPFILLCMGLYEFSGGQTAMIHTLGIFLIGSRLLHAAGLHLNKGMLRLGGMVGTLTALTIVSALLIATMIMGAPVGSAGTPPQSHNAAHSAPEKPG